MRLVHLTPASNAAAIERGGIRGAPVVIAGEDEGPVALAGAVFAMPVLANLWTTLQWLRELRRWQAARMVTVILRVPDDEPVHVGRYGRPHRAVSAAEAAAWIRTEPAGGEIVLPRSVARRELVAVREVTQRIG